MRTAISRTPVFEGPAGTDVEISLADEIFDETWRAALRAGAPVYCSMSNAVKRRFPVPSFRPSDYAGPCGLEMTVALSEEGIAARVPAWEVEAFCPLSLSPAKSPEKTAAAVEKAFSKLGETDYHLSSLAVEDPKRLFAPMSALNDLRRDLVERLDSRRAELPTAFGKQFLRNIARADLGVRLEFEIIIDLNNDMSHAKRRKVLHRPQGVLRK
jgi:hypothetical protein